ncbi:MAG: hypothetical protein OSA99_04500 [Acidimicrobiales bacterium]|nr:hypothetical protein [Acidimicrobiales bacterium]
MSDQFGPGSSDDHGAMPPPPPPPPPMSPVDAPLTLDTQSEVTTKSGIGGRVVAGIAGIVLLVAGTAFAVTQLGSSGPSTAEEAVAELFEAAGDEDLLGLMAALDPGERDALRGPVEDLFGELERLEVLDASFELGAVGGIDFEFSDVTYRTEPVRDGLSRVYVTGGTVTTTVDGDDLPVGDFVSDTIERFGGDVSDLSTSETGDILEGTSEMFLAARNGGDGWRVSIGYTIAEASRIDAGQPIPTDVVEPVGADSPEAAVRGMADAAAGLDVRGMIARLSPNEFRALQEYAMLALGPIESEVAGARDDVEIQIDELELRSEGSGDRATVFVDGFAVSATLDGETLALSYLDGCLDVQGDAVGEFFSFFLGAVDSPFSDGPICGDELEALANGDFEGGFGEFEDEFTQEFGALERSFADFEDLETPSIGIATERVDGEWFVAPIASGLDATVAFVEVIDRTHLDAMVDFVETFFLGFGFGLDGEFENDFGFDDDFTIEEFEDLGDQFSPTTTFIPGVEPVPGSGIDQDQKDNGALQALVFSFATSEEMADCMLADLTSLEDFLRYDLIDAFLYEYDPIPEAADAFDDILEACQAF